MDVAILGASGDCGREIAAQLVAARLLAPTERLQLVGRGEGRSARVLHGLVSDLTDAYAEYVPDLDVALSPDDIVADLWVVAAGQTMPVDGALAEAGRGKLAGGNAAVFQGYANALARHGQGSEVVIIVSNPVELGVAIFAEAVGRRRVLGIGAYSDTLRFRREIAADLGVRRQRVGGFMIGEHGDGQIPVWSSVQIHGMEADELATTIATLRKGHTLEDFAALCARERQVLSGLLHEGRVAEAFARVDTLPPDARVVVKPYVTHLSGAKTVMATANVTVDLLRTLLDGREVLVAGQVMLHDDFYGLSGPLGVPVIAGPGGIARVVEIPLDDGERAQIETIGHAVQRKVAAWMGNQG
jgi:malate dehydrogenase